METKIVEFGKNALDAIQELSNLAWAYSKTDKRMARIDARLLDLENELKQIFTKLIN